MRFYIGQTVKITAGEYKNYIGQVGTLDRSGEEPEYNIIVPFDDAPDEHTKLRGSELQPLAAL